MLVVRCPRPSKLQAADPDVSTSEVLAPKRKRDPSCTRDLVLLGSFRFLYPTSNTHMSSSSLIDLHNSYPLRQSPVTSVVTRLRPGSLGY